MVKVETMIALVIIGSIGLVVGLSICSSEIAKTQSDTADRIDNPPVISINLEKRSGYAYVDVTNLGSERSYVVFLKTTSGNVVTGNLIARIPLIERGETGRDKVYVGTDSVEIICAGSYIGDTYYNVYYKIATPEPTATKVIKASTNDQEFVIAAEKYLAGKTTIADVRTAAIPDNGFLKSARDHLFTLDEHRHDFTSDGRISTAAQQRADAEEKIIRDEIAGYKGNLGL